MILKTTMPGKRNDSPTAHPPVVKHSEDHDIKSLEPSRHLHVMSEVMPSNNQEYHPMAQTYEASINTTQDISLYTLPCGLSCDFSETNEISHDTCNQENEDNLEDLQSTSVSMSIHIDSSNYSYDDCYNDYNNFKQETSSTTPSYKFENSRVRSNSSVSTIPTQDSNEAREESPNPTRINLSPSTYQSECSNKNRISSESNSKRKETKTMPWYCVTRPIHEQTRDIKISSVNKSASINRSRLLAKCHSMLEYCTSRVGKVTMSEDNIQEMNFNHSWGDQLPRGVKGNTIRIAYQNVNKSLSTKPNPATDSLLQTLKDMEVDVFMASETNRNWRSATYRNALKQKVRRIWPNNRIAFSTSKIGEKFLNDEMLPGGTVTMVFDQIATRTVKIGEDEEEMGRFSFVTVEGQGEQKLTYITGYQICKGAMKGTSTSCMQQKEVINSSEMKRGVPTSNPSTECLRVKFINDLIKLINELKAAGHAIILALDANETPAESLFNGAIREGSIEFLLQQTGLTEVFQHRHQQIPDSTTTTPGRCIDRMATWGVEVQRATLLRANEPATSDHLAIVIDVNINILFRQSCSSFTQPKGRKLTSGNPETVKKYVSFLKTQFQNHKIFERCRSLREAMEKDEFTLKHQRQLYILDKQVTEILLGAENQCSKRTTDRNFWSPELDNAGTAIKYGKCRVKLNGLLDDNMRELGDQLKIPEQHHRTLSIHECQQLLSKAWKRYRHIQSEAKERRKKHLKQRAEQHAQRGNGDVAASIKHLRRQERLKYDYRSIQRAYGVNKQGLTTLDVPDPDSDGRLLLTNKNDIHEYLLRRNERHYSQATFTTFGDAGPGYAFIDPDSPESDRHIDAILEGAFEPWASASPHVKELISALRCTVEEELDTNLRLEDFKSLFKSIPESTASSVSGLHYGHYKVLSKLEDESFIQVLFDIVNIAFRTRSPLPRWKGSTQIMLEKGKGPGIENLRIIQLLEADMNWLHRFLWGRKLNHHALKAGAYHHSQFAVPGKLCGSAILNRVLYFDMLRQTKQCGALMDNDATAAFDRVLPALCVVTCRQLGMPKEAQRFFFRILRQMEYTVTTAHGKSTQTYMASGNSAAPGQGVIQGGGASGPNYASQQHPVLKAYENNCPPAEFYHVSRIQARFRRWASGFADDMSLFLNQSGIAPRNQSQVTPQRVGEELQNNLTRYEAYFATVGGALNLKKCFYYLVEFIWSGTTWRYKANAEINAPQVTVSPTTLDDSGTPQPIAWLEANDAQRTLGSHIAPDGSSAKQLDVLLGHLKTWQGAIRNISNGNLHAKWLSYQNVFTRKVMYPMIGHSFSKHDLQEIQRPTEIELLHLLGLNEHFPRAPLRASLSFGGMGCPSFHAQHVADKTVLFLHHMRENAEIAEVMKASMSLTQLECGTAKSFFSLSPDPWYELVTPTWINHIWRECALKDIEILFHKDHFWLPSRQRENDATLMDLADQMFGSTHLHQINQCRIALQVTYLSDITSVDGKRILPAYYDGRGHEEVGRRTRLNWPPIGPLPSSHWALWKEFLNRLCGTALRLPIPLGAWYQEGEILTEILFFLYDRRLITHHKKQWFEFSPYHPTSRTRYALTKRTFRDLHLLKHAEVVDVTHRGDSIYIISKNRQHVIPSSAATEISTIRDLYSSLPRSLQRLMGHIEWPDEETTKALADAIRQGTAVGASDGSVRTKEGRASHAWILHAPNGAEIIGKGPVDGNNSSRTSHRAELQGQAGLFLMVSMLVQFYSIVRGHVNTYCDNAPVVNKIRKGWSMLRLRHTKGPDSDLQATMRVIQRQLDNKCSYTTEWVRSHQDKETPLHTLPREVALNVRMDTATKEAYDLPQELQTREVMEVLPAEGCAVYISNQKVSSAIYSTLLERWHEEEARSYLLARHGIDAALFRMIQWRSMKFALGKFSHHRRATAVKAIHRHLPTQEKLYNQQRATMSAICPRCVTAPETNAHVYACSNAEATKQRLKDWGELPKQLDKLQTASIIMRTWNIYLRPLLALPLHGESIDDLLDNTHGELAFFLRAAIDEQNEIGWSKLLLGMGSSMWQTLQHLIDVDNPKPPRRDASDWMNRAIHQLLKFSLRCWKSRNTSIHGSTFKERKQKALDRARAKITEIYENPPKLAPQFRSIAEVPMAQRLRLTLPAAEKWIALIHHQARVTVHNMKLLMRQHKPIPEHFKAMTEASKKLSNRRSKQQSRAHSKRVQHDVKAMRMRLYRSIASPDRASCAGYPATSPSPRRHPRPRRHPP